MNEEIIKNAKNGEISDEEVEKASGRGRYRRYGSYA